MPKSIARLSNTPATASVRTFSPGRRDPRPPVQVSRPVRIAPVAQATLAASPHQLSTASQGSARPKSARHWGSHRLTTAAHSPHSRATASSRPAQVARTEANASGFGSASCGGPKSAVGSGRGTGRV